MKKIYYILYIAVLTLFSLTSCAISEKRTDDAKPSITQELIHEDISNDKTDDTEYLNKSEKDTIVSETEEYGSEPEFISAYTTPQDFSDYIFDYIIKVDKDFYQLPAPVRVFMTNGWEFAEDYTDKVILADGYKNNIIMSRNGINITVEIANYDTIEHIYDDCVVVAVESTENIIDTSFLQENVPELSTSFITWNNDEEQYLKYSIQDNLYVSQGYFYEYINDNLSSIKVSYYYTEGDRNKRKQQVLAGWEKDETVTLDQDECVYLHTDTTYQIDLDNDGKDDKINVKIYDVDFNDCEILSVIINGEPTLVYDNFIYLNCPMLLKTSDDTYLLALCYFTDNDYQETYIYQIKGISLRMSYNTDGGIVSYKDHVLIVRDFKEFDGFSVYENMFIVSNNGKLEQIGDSALYHSHVSAFDFIAYTYDSECNKYQQQIINKGTTVTFLHTDWDTVWIELEDGTQGYLKADEVDVWDCFSGFKDNDEDICDGDGEKEKTLALEAYGRIFRNEKKLISVYNREYIYLNEYIQFIGEKHDIPYKITNYAVADMDGDDIPDIILKLSNEIDEQCYEVLHYDEGGVYSYSFDSDKLLDIKADGTFLYSIDASDSWYGQLVFSTNKVHISRQAYTETVQKKDNLSTYYYINYENVTKEEFNTYCEEQNKKEDVTWFDFDIMVSLKR